MNQLQKIFEYNISDDGFTIRKQIHVRTVSINQEPWFVVKDVCDILEINNVSDALNRLEDDEVDLTEVIDGLGRKQYTNITNESGLYNLVLGSRKPEAKNFKRWITHEVLPSIRKHGMYAKDELLDNPDLLIDVITKLKVEREQKLKLLAENAILKPKAEFFDEVACSKDAIDMGSAAKVLNYGKGRTTLFKILREKGILDRNNIPYQEYIDRGYFRTIEQKFNKPDGSTCINIKTLVYQRGLDYIRKVIKQLSN
jgi:anti-repressor protein